MDETNGWARWIFMQDGVRSQRSKNWLSTRCRFIQRWQANSTDLKIIERKSGAKKSCLKITAKKCQWYKNNYTNVWDDFPQIKINDLASSFYQRLHLVI